MSLIAELLPAHLPPRWQIVDQREDGVHYLAPDGLSVIVSVAIQADGKRWLHLSCARRHYLPTWGDLTLIKNLFVGPDRYACQIFPPEDKYVRIHKFALHLFSCLDEWPLPEFSGFIKGIPIRSL